MRDACLEATVEFECCFDERPNALESTWDGEDAPLEWVETVGDLRLPPKTDERLQELMERNNDGLLEALHLLVFSLE